MEIVNLLAAFFLGVLAFYLLQRFRLQKFNSLAQQIIQQAEIEAVHIKRSNEFLLKEQQIAQSKEFELAWQTERKKILKEEERLKQREDKLESRLNLVEKKILDTEKREAVLIARKKELDEEKIQLQEKQKGLHDKLEKVAGISSGAAKALLLQNLEADLKLETARYIQNAREEAKEEAERQASKIISTAIHRLAASTVSEVTLCTVSLPNDELKGRIIGREGRNIRALEKACGVNLIMDDTPQAVVISSFDPLRRQIAKLALTELIADGRIHPTRIEEAVEKAKEQLQKLIKQFGEDAALRVGIVHIHPDLLVLLGKLKFRCSLGQNVLDHSLEVAHLMGIMASELNLNVALARRIGLLHDIGKAMPQEVQGTHAVIGHDLALKYGESKEVANGIGCHHFEMEPLTVEASLCASADAISASRPGARIEAIEEYIKRLGKLEKLASNFPGVEKAYALQAGREVRVIALPDTLKDEDLWPLARDLTKRIESELDYPGKIKVTVMREKRVVDYAM